VYEQQITRLIQITTVNRRHKLLGILAVLKMNHLNLQKYKC